MTLRGEEPSTWLGKARRRHVLEWSLAYVGAAWLALQLIDLAARSWDWPDAAERGLHILTVFGFPATVIVAWYHGKTGRQRVSGRELVVLASLLLAAGVAVRMLAA